MVLYQVTFWNAKPELNRYHLLGKILKDGSCIVSPYGVPSFKTNIARFKTCPKKAIADALNELETKTFIKYSRKEAFVSLKAQYAWLVHGLRIKK